MIITTRSRKSIIGAGLIGLALTACSGEPDDAPLEERENVEASEVGSYPDRLIGQYELETLLPSEGELPEGLTFAEVESRSNEVTPEFLNATSTAGSYQEQTDEVQRTNQETIDFVADQRDGVDGASECLVALERFETSWAENRQARYEEAESSPWDQAQVHVQVEVQGQPEEITGSVSITSEEASTSDNAFLPLVGDQWLKCVPLDLEGELPGFSNSEEVGSVHVDHEDSFGFWEVNEEGQTMVLINARYADRHLVTIQLFTDDQDDVDALADTAEHLVDYIDTELQALGGL